MSEKEEVKEGEGTPLNANKMAPDYQLSKLIGIEEEDPQEEDDDEDDDCCDEEGEGIEGLYIDQPNLNNENAELDE